MIAQSDRRERRDNLWATRILLGALSMVHGIGGIKFDYAYGVSGVVHEQELGVLFACGLIASGLLMIVAAVGQRIGHSERWCREFSASMLGVAWIAVGFHSMIGGADTVTLLSPLYVTFCGIAWWSEASAARQTKIAKQIRTACNEEIVNKATA